MVLNPLISVIMPVYNAEQYIQASLNSILEQTYPRLEIIIVNDGSTDASKKILETYHDPRICIIEHEKNKGLISALNEAIQISKGDFIIRMDADDIAFKDRIQKQVDFLIANPRIDIVGSHAIFFEKDIHNPLPNWELDLRTNSSEEINKALVWENCMIHPSICMRSNIAKAFLYEPSQKNYEDYDFWLRAVSKNTAIAKINEALIYYRVQAQSITQKNIRKSNFYYQKAMVKWRFVKNSFLSSTYKLFVTKVFFSILADLFLGTAKAIKSI